MMALKYKASQSGEKPPQTMMIFVGTFTISWLLLGYAAGLGASNHGKILSWIAAIFVLVSMLGVLPWQRKNMVIDGPGFAMFGMAWVFLAMTNAS
jgi:hypothetical protein